MALTLPPSLSFPATAVLERTSTEVECRAAGMRWVQQTWQVQAECGSR